MEAMAWQSTPYTIPLIIVAVINTILGLYVWRTKNARGAKTGALLMFACAQWIFCYALELAGANLFTKVFWNKAQYLGVVFVPTLWLIFTLKYTGEEKWLTHRNVILLCTVPILTLVLTFTNNAHSLLWSRVTLNPNGPLPELEKHYEVGFWILLLYTYVLLLLSVYLLVETLIRSRHLYRWQASALLVGAVVPSVGRVITQFRLSSYSFLDLEVVGLAVSSLTVAWCIFRLRLLDIVPFARETIIESMGDAIIVLDSENHIVDLNPAAQRLIAYSASEAMGQRIDQVWPSGTKELDFSINGAKKSKEITISNGSLTKTYDVCIFPLTDWRERLVSKVIVLRDITERRVSEEALRESEKRHSTILDAVPDMVYELDPNGAILYANRFALQFLGYSGAHPETLNLADLLDEKELQRASRVAYDLLNGKEIPQSAVYNVRTRDGRAAPVEAHIRLLTGNGRRQTILGVARDVTERQRAEQLLRQSEEKYRALFEESRDVVYATTPDGKLLDINPAGVAIFGYASKEEILSINIARDLYRNPNDRETFQNTIAKQGFVKDYELALKRKDGRKVIVLVTANAVRDDSDNIIAYRGMMRDVTEKKLLEQQFFQAQKMESVGTLAGGIAHDFNNLLGGILGYASFIKTKITKDHRFYNYLDTIEKSAIRASELTAQLLAFARGGKYDIKPTDLNRIVKETIEIIGRTFDKSIEIKTNLHATLPTVEADGGQLQQALMNLCLNARDSMPAGGALTIDTGVATLGDEYASTHLGVKLGSYVTLSVTDTGIGMNEETRQRIFEPFFTTKEKGKGTGLGLSMVYGVTKNHGGYISVYSEPGIGSTFKVYLPSSSKPEAVVPFKSEMPQGKNELILVVDDEQPIRSLAKDVLEAYGYRVITTENGAEAVELYTKHRDEISLVILDMVMPKMGGHETFLKLKELNPEVRALLSTGYSQAGKAQEILDSGVMGFIQKPYQLNELLSKLKSVLETS